jgi:hypothetical protein
MKAKDAVIVVLAMAVAALSITLAFNFLAAPKIKPGYTEIEGFLELHPYPKISEAVPTVMVYTLTPMYNHDQIYLTEHGMPLSSLQDFSENDLVNIEGALYYRDAADKSQTYWMIETFTISRGD